MNKKGWSLTELLTAVGIATILASIATISYLKYYQQGQFTKIQESGNNFFTAVEACLFKYDDATKCDTIAELNFNCEHCTKMDLIPNDAKMTDPYGDRVRLFMKVGEFESIAIYRSDEIVSGRLCIRHAQIAQKFCSFAPSNRPTTKHITAPVRKCDTLVDCKPGQKCEHFSGCVI